MPYKHGVELFDRAAQPREFLRISGGHNDGFMLSGGTYIEGLRAFLDRYLARPL